MSAGEECVWGVRLLVGDQAGEGEKAGEEAERERKGPNLGASGRGEGGYGPPWAGGLQEILRLDIWAGDEEGRAPKDLECCYPSDQ